MTEEIEKPEVDTPETDVAENPVKVEVVEAAAEKPQIDGIAQLKAQLEAEKAARLEAERRANEAQQQAYSARNEVEDTNLRLVENALQTLQSNTSTLKANLAQAMQAGDFERAADIQEALADAKAKTLQLENGKQAMQERPKPAAPSPVGDRTETAIAQLGIKGKSAEWVRAHPEYVGSTQKFNAMVGAHNVAVGKGIEPDTPAYFREVERVLDIGSKYEMEAEPDEDVQPARRVPPPAAPVSRSGAQPGQNPRSVRLSKEEAEIAAMNKMTPEEYWRNKQTLQREGRMN